MEHPSRFSHHQRGGLHLTSVQLWNPEKCHRSYSDQELSRWVIKETAH